METNTDHLIQRLNRELHAITEVAKTLTAPLEFTQSLNAILDKIIGVLPPAEIGAIMLWDQSSGLFRIGAAFGYDQERLKEIGLRSSESITGKVFDRGEAVLLSDPGAVAAAMADMQEVNREILAAALGTKTLPICTLAAPITSSQKYGVLVLETLSSQEFFINEDIAFVQTLADLIALAIERARLQNKAAAVRETQETERLRSELMATLSHELRLPLTAIKGYASAMLLDEIEWTAEKQTEFLQQIDQECSNMQVILSEILDSALIDVSQVTVKPIPIDLSLLVRDICAEFQRRTSRHHLVTDFPSDFPLVHADPHWIKQVLRNLLDNAIKYSPDGGLIIIRAEIRANDIVIRIADQGIGISPENMIPLFEKYFRAPPPDGYQIPGTGLGLPIARALVEAHGGHIWADSELGQGTTISFTLPHDKGLQ